QCVALGVGEARQPTPAVGHDLPDLDAMAAQRGDRSFEIVGGERQLDVAGLARAGRTQGQQRAACLVGGPGLAGGAVLESQNALVEVAHPFHVGSVEQDFQQTEHEVPYSMFIQTLLTWVYSRTLSAPRSRPKPEPLTPPN